MMVESKPRRGLDAANARLSGGIVPRGQAAPVPTDAGVRGADAAPVPDAVTPQPEPSQPTQVQPPAPAPDQVAARPESRKEKGSPASIWLPTYMDAEIKQWIKDHPGTNLRTMMLHGLKSLGLTVADEDLVVQRKRRF